MKRISKPRQLLLTLLVTLLQSPLGLTATAEPAHENWTALLQACVRATADGRSTAADYDCFARRETALDAYLEELSSTQESSLRAWPRDSQLAFLINAYNAWTVKLILGAWPDIQSIRELGSLLRSPWKKEFIPLLGETISLDDIEHGMIRAPGRFDEPRIHFAVNCASIGCPALRREAFTGDAIETQLEEQTRRFLADPSRNRYAGDKLEVSSIFKWYREDFERGWRGADSLAAFLGDYADALGLSEAQRNALLSGELAIGFLDYDWRLNARQ
jgi:hypothetical protein